jgi:hypothetical protein
MNEILNLNADTIRHYKKCFDDNNSPKDLEVLNWQFFENENKNFVDIEYDHEQDKTAAIYATFGIQFKIENNVYLGSQSLDTITDIDYRGKGLFIKLAKDVYRKAKNEGVALVYGFPNGNSIHGFKKKLGWEVLDPVPFLIKPLKSRYFTSKVKFLKYLPSITLSFSSYKESKQFTIVANSIFPETVNTIWKSFSKEIKVAVHRDKKYLDWRYLSKPFESYKIAHCYGNDNKYLGYVVYTVKEKHGGKIAYIMELIYDLEVPKSGEELLKYAINEIKKENADCILTWCMEHSPNVSAFSKEFFIKMPEKFRPIELHFGARSFKENLNSIINNRNNWYLSYSDSDTV